VTVRSEQQLLVREALARCESEGLVVRRPNTGYLVAPLLDRAALDDLYDVRLLLEPSAAARAARYATTAEVSAMRGSLEQMMSPLVGVATGLVTGAAGVFVIPAVPYLQALGLSRDELVQALGLSFTVSTLALAGGLLWRGALGGGELSASLLALIPAVLGMLLGQWLRQRISAVLFKRVFFIGLGVLGGHLLISG